MIMHKKLLYSVYTQNEIVNTVQHEIDSRLETKKFEVTIQKVKRFLITSKTPKGLITKNISKINLKPIRACLTPKICN